MNDLPITVQELLRDIERMQERLAQRRESANQAKKADRRARKLLLDSLNGYQKNQLLRSERHKTREPYFYAKGSKSGKRYRINGGFGFIATEVDKRGKLVRHYCAKASQPVPRYDHMLAAKVMLELNEPRFLRLAVKWRLYPWDRP